jgi:DNA-binding GntR family transcriptional regulator
VTRAADKLIQQITQDIISGLLRPGDRLEEEVLAKKFGVSRTPIREAIRAMVGRGLLEAKPRKGAIIRILSPKEIIDLFEVAAELEAMACRLAATFITEEQAQQIKEKLDQCTLATKANDKTAYSMANIEFHSAVHAACGNQWLIEQLQQIGMHINTYRSLPFELRGRLQKSTKEHTEIYDAILAGDSETASSLMREHMTLQGQRLPAIIKHIESVQ